MKLAALTIIASLLASPVLAAGYGPNVRNCSEGQARAMMASKSFSSHSA